MSWDQAALERVTAQAEELEAENRELWAEVERLRKVAEAASKLHKLHVKRDRMIENDTWESDKAMPVWKSLENAERRLGVALAALEAGDG